MIGSDSRPQSLASLRVFGFRNLLYNIVHRFKNKFWNYKSWILKNFLTNLRYWLSLWFWLLNNLGDSSLTFLMTLALNKSWMWPNITANSPNVVDWIWSAWSRQVTLFGSFDNLCSIWKPFLPKKFIFKMNKQIQRVQIEKLKFPIGGTTSIKKLSSYSVGIFKSHFEQFITTQPGMIDLVNNICQDLTYNDSKSIKYVSKEFKVWNCSG